MTTYKEKLTIPLEEWQGILRRGKAEELRIIQSKLYLREYKKTGVPPQFQAITHLDISFWGRGRPVSIDDLSIQLTDTKINGT